MFLTFGSNIGSLQAQTKLREATGEQSRLSESLSSGLRINRASDDAAGLAIADLLRADRAIFTQGLRNGNDAINATRVFDGALEEIGSIAVRIQELAEQSANGTLSDSERVSINAEAQALRDEATRIVSNTTFNDINLLDGSTTSLSIQLGNSSVDQQFEFSTTSTQTFTADGTFQSQTTFSVQRGPYYANAADINGDGNQDMLVANRTDGEISIFLGNGDGTFQAETTINESNDLGYIGAADFDGDGNLDLLTATRASVVVGVRLGNGDGTFGGSSTFDVENLLEELTVADVNGDSVLDIISTNVNSSSVSVLLGNGDGTFQADVTFVTGGSPNGITNADIDGDGNIDLIVAEYGGNSVSVLLGNGNGTFQARTSFGAAAGSDDVELADFDGDGELDLVVSNRGNNSVSILIGNGDGTFQADATFAVGTNPEGVKTNDIDGDGNVDIITADYNDNTISILLGNGDGTFQARTTLATGNDPLAPTLADFTGDGFSDILVVNRADDSIGLFVANSTSSGSNQTTNSLLIPEFSLLTQSGATSAITSLDTVIEDVASARGTFGSLESRLVFAVTNLQLQAENFSAAESRIRDLDVARAVAEYTAAGVRTQLATSVLAQVNQEPALLLQLLGR